MSTPACSVMGTVAPACVWKSNVTFSREESQEIDHVLEIYHHCFFFFNKVGQSKRFALFWSNVFSF